MRPRQDLFLQYFDVSAGSDAPPAGSLQQQQGGAEAAEAPPPPPQQQQHQHQQPPPPPPPQPQQAARAALASTPLGFCWLLFCTARSALLPQQAELVSSFALLLACTQWMLQHMPRTLQHGGGGGGGGGSAVSAGESSEEQQLVALAASHGAADHVAMVRQLAGRLQQLVEEVVPAVVGSDAGGRSAAGPNQAAATAAAGGASLFDAAGRPHPAVVAALLQQYELQAGGADLDPFSFLAHPPRGGSAATPRPASGQAAAGAAAMEVDAPAAAAGGAAAPEPAGPAAHEDVAAAGSPEGARTPSRQRPASSQQQPGSPAARKGRAMPGREGGGAAAAFPDASFHTPSPAKRRQPLPPPPPATPISAALGSSAWLRGTVAGQPEGPSQGLRALMQAARTDAGECRCWWQAGVVWWWRCSPVPPAADLWTLGARVGAWCARCTPLPSPISLPQASKPRSLRASRPWQRQCLR